MRLELNKVHHPVTALGPGRRVGLWTQGCSIRCAGCISRDTWDPDAARAIEVATLVDWITGIEPAGLDGITVSGGEPFDQAPAVEELLRKLDAWRRAEGRAVDFLLYSGYPLRRLRARHPELLDMADAVIVGPYVARQPTELLWRGSANQRLVPLTALGHERYADHLEARPLRPPLQVSVDSSIWYVGVPRAGDIERIDAALTARGLRQSEVSWRA